MSMIKEMLNISKIAAEASASSKNDSMIVINNKTGVGTGADNSLYTQIIPGNQIPNQVQQALFHGSDLARKMVSKLSQDALKKGVYVKMDDAKLASKIKMKLDDLNSIEKFCNAGIFARNFGGSVIVLGIDDGRDSSVEVDYKNIKGIYSLDVIDRRWVYPAEYDQNPMSKTYGEPSVYEVYNISMQDIRPSFIHRSRLIVFNGLLTTDDEKLKRNSWDICLYDLILPILNDFNAAYSYTIAAMNKSTQGVFKIRNLNEQLTSMNDASIQKRWDIVDKFRSIYRSIVVDADSEEFEYVEANLTGFEPILQNYMIRLSAAADMPVTVLMGQSPAGMSATGESDLRLWNSNVSAYQQQVLKYKFEYLCKLIMLSEGIEAPEIWDIEFPSPYESTPSEITERRKAVSEIDSKAIASGIFTAQEVAIFRSQPGGYDMDMTLTNLGKLTREKQVTETYKKELTDPIQPETQNINTEVV